MGAASYAIRLLAAEEGPVASSSGIILSVELLPNRLIGTSHSLIIAGASDTASPGRTPLAGHLRKWLVRNRQHLDRGATIGKEAFRLARGWMASPMPRQAPTKTVRPDAGVGMRKRPLPSTSDVPDGSKWLSVETASGIDLALSWVEEELGRQMADQVADRIAAAHSSTYGDKGYRCALVERPWER